MLSEIMHLAGRGGWEGFIALARTWCLSWLLEGEWDGRALYAKGTA